MATIPSLEALKEISSKLNQAGLTYALGGSGLLYAKGLVDTVNDWDITIEARWDQMEPILKGLNYQLSQSSDDFASGFLCKLDYKKTKFDLIGEFAIAKPEAVYQFPTVVTGEWEGIPIGNLAMWAHAYKLIGCREKAELINSYLGKTPYSPTFH